jgi:uridylate kinase
MINKILIKISGESLKGKDGYGISKEKLTDLSKKLIKIKESGLKIAVVIGAGNIWRYRDTKDLDLERSTSDYIGMLGTMMNTVSIKSTVENLGQKAKIYSSLYLPQLTENYIQYKARTALLKDYIVFLAGGTGNPFFTTDTASALRALELNCDLLVKVTNVDGLYTEDPLKNPQAKVIKKISYQEILEKNYQIMDQTAFSLCKTNNLPIQIIGLNNLLNIPELSKGKEIGTKIHN